MEVTHPVLVIDTTDHGLRLNLGDWKELMTFSSHGVYR